MKKYLYSIACCGLILLFAGTAMAQTAKAPMKAVNNAGEVEEIGFITFNDTPEGLVMDVDVFDLPVGTHNVSLHKKADCTKIMQGHKAAAEKSKDKGAPCTPPDLTVGSDGKAKVQHKAADMKVRDVKDHAIVIHSKAKDGSPAKPLACGVIK